MKILIIQQKMIGDVLTSSIMFEALRQKYPNAQLDYLINEHTFSVVDNNPFIDNFIFFTKNEEKNKLALFSLAKKIKAANYDIVIDVYSKLSSNIITLISGAKIKISKYKWYTYFIYTHAIKELKSAKTNAGLAIENRLHLLHPILKEDTKIIKPEIYLSATEIETSKQFLINHNVDLNKSIIMISILGSSENKSYPLEYMANIIDDIVNQTNAQILFNYIPTQKESAKRIFELCKITTQNHIFLNVYGENLREFLTITSHCDALIGNEGGAVNMAKALNISTFTIFSPWISKEIWSIFEDNKTHVSVHLKDFHPDLYKNKTSKKIKTDYVNLYNKFLPNLIKPKLKLFLKNH